MTHGTEFDAGNDIRCNLIVYLTFIINIFFDCIENFYLPLIRYLKGTGNKNYSRTIN